MPRQRDPFAYDKALLHSRALDWKKDQQRLAEKLEAMRLRDAEKATEKAAKEAAEKAARAAQTARFLALGMKYEAHKKDGETYPELTPDEFAEAGRLLGESGAWEKLAEDSEGLSWRVNAAAHLDMLAFKKDIDDRRAASTRTGVAFNPHASIVDAVFEAHALRGGF